MQVLASPASFKKSWFLQVRDICQQYSLPEAHPLLSNPPSRSSFKRTARQKVLDFWNAKLREPFDPTSPAYLPSLGFLKANFMSLCHPHPIWTSAGSSPYEVKKATVQARMLSGRYRTCWLRRHLSGDQSGNCKVPGCTGMPGTLQHLATGECPGLHSSLVKSVALWKSFLSDNPILFPVVKLFSLGDPTVFLSFLLDPTTQPQVISLTQTHGTIITEKLCYMTRTWLFYFHKERLKLLELWK
jgi:hypothetical protein